MSSCETSNQYKCSPSLAPHLEKPDNAQQRLISDFTRRIDGVVVKVKCKY